MIQRKKKRNDMEIDFLISNNKLRYRLYPIEVKSGKSYSAKYKKRIGETYIIHPRNLIKKDGVVCIPPYMTFCL